MLDLDRTIVLNGRGDVARFLNELAATIAPQKELITSKELAKERGQHIKTIARKIRESKVRTARVGKYVAIYVSDKHRIH